MFLSPCSQAAECGRVFRLRRLKLGCQVIQLVIGEVERTDFHESHAEPNVDADRQQVSINGGAAGHVSRDTDISATVESCPWDLRGASA
jgi:hypothetical protein